MAVFQVSVNGLDKAGSTPIHWAAHGGHIECIEMLLRDPKCQVNVQVAFLNQPNLSAQKAIITLDFFDLEQTR